MTSSLVVRVKHAKGLKDADGMPFSGKSDPYVKLRLLNPDGEKLCAAKQTKVVQNTSDPEWNEEITFAGITAPAACILKINVLDKDYLVGKFADFLNKDDDLGDAEVHLGTLSDSKEWQEFNDIVVAGWVWKSRVSFDLQTGGTWGNGPAESNVLTVRVKNAVGLRDADGYFQGKNDPYVYCTLVDFKGKKVGEAKQTKILEEGGTDVEWNEDLRWEGLATPCALTLKVNVYDKDTLTKDDDLGDTKIHLGTLRYSPDFQKFDNIEIYKKNKSKLNLEICTHNGWGNNKPLPPAEVVMAPGGCKCC